MEYKSIEQNLGSGIKELGDNIRSVPHIVIGKKDKLTNNTQQKPIFNQHEQDLIDKAKKGLFLLLIIGIILYALWRIFIG